MNWKWGLYYAAWGIACITILALFGGCQGKTREQYQQEQVQNAPVLICKQKGVEVWRVYDVEAHLWVYFTVPNGDVSWTVPGDDDNPPKRFHVQGCSKVQDARLLSK